MWNSSNSTISDGGYMDTTNNSTISGDGQSKTKKTGVINCVPVMIAHLNQYGENLMIWGSPVRMVTFLGIVQKIDVVSTKVTFEFRDETGTINGLKWLDGETVSYDSPVNLKSYARVYGSIRQQNDENYVLIANIQPMEHMNELLAHLMEVTLVCLKGKKKTEEISKQDHSLVQNSGTSFIITPNIPGLNREQALIVSLIKNGHPENGAVRNDLKAQVPANVACKVDEILEFLSGEGHIYTTVTDDHFKLIE